MRSLEELLESVDLDDVKKQRSTTPPEERPRCPECLGVDIERKQDRNLGHAQRKPGRYRCQRPACCHHFDTPVKGYAPDPVMHPTSTDSSGIEGGAD